MTTSPIANALLLRRPSEFFIGKVLRLNVNTAPQGWPTGYYRLMSISEGNIWNYEYISDTPPPGEPIYKYDRVGQLDIPAIPRTVWSPKIRNSFLLWGALAVGLWLLSGAMGNYSEAFSDGWTRTGVMLLSALMFGAVMVAPLIKWGLQVEPVRTMKIVYVVMAVFLVLSSRAQRTGTAARTDQAGREG